MRGLGKLRVKIIEDEGLGPACRDQRGEAGPPANVPTPACPDDEYLRIGGGGVWFERLDEGVVLRCEQQQWDADGT